MLVFMSLYQMVDGVFVSNVVGENALSALNIVYPIPSIIIAISIMLATGGSAIVAKNMGEGKLKEAKQNFSMIIYTGLSIGVVCSIIGMIFIKPIIWGLGATDILYQYCYDYLLILILFCPVAILQMLFQIFLVTAGKPHLGLALTVIGGLSNILLDYLFIVQMQIGVRGAAIGTIIGYAIPAIVGFIYFIVNRKGTLYLVKPRFRLQILVQTCLNGSSEMVTNLAVAITTLLFNKIMLKYMGENGVAAITIVLYAQFLLTSIFMGFSSGVAPIFSYNYGNGNHKQTKKLFKMSMTLIIIFSVLMFVMAILLAKPVISVFTSRDSAIFDITYHGFLLFAISYLYTGVNIFASSMFTAFSNGRISAIISFLRTFVFLVLSLIILPIIIGSDGIWLSVPLAELLSFGVSIMYIISNRHEYQYL
jgi:putative MATE family efflux protein